METIYPTSAEEAQKLLAEQTKRENARLEKEATDGDK